MKKTALLAGLTTLVFFSACNLSTSPVDTEQLGGQPALELSQAEFLALLFDRRLAQCEK